MKIIIIEDVEIVLDNKRYLLEAGDVIIIESQRDYSALNRNNRIRKMREDERIDSNRSLPKKEETKLNATDEILARFLTTHKENFIRMGLSEITKASREYLESKGRELPRQRIKELIQQFVKKSRKIKA